MLAILGKESLFLKVIQFLTDDHQNIFVKGLVYEQIDDPNNVPPFFSRVQLKHFRKEYPIKECSNFKSFYLYYMGNDFVNYTIKK